MRHAELPTLRLPRTARSFRRPVAISAVLHGGLAVLWLWYAGRSVASRAVAPGAPEGGARQITYVALPPYRAARAAPPATHHVAPPVARVQVRDVTPSPTVADLAQVSLVTLRRPDFTGGLSGAGPGSGPGSGAGVGSGAAAGGADGDIFPPQPRYSILPPLPRPASVRGRSFRVHFWVDPAGRVTRVVVTPAIPDAAYGKQFLALMQQYTFTPALRPDGTPVSGETVLTFTL